MGTRQIDLFIICLSRIYLDYMSTKRVTHTGRRDIAGSDYSRLSQVMPKEREMGISICKGFHSEHVRVSS